MSRESFRLGIMLAALTMIFVLSHAFRTTIAIAADPIALEFSAKASALAAVAGGFHLAFAAAQPVVGVALDRYGPKPTIAVAFVLSILGCAVSAMAPNIAILILGQWLIGFGCAPALLAAMVFISRRYEAGRFAALSGLVLSVGGAGMLLTGTPLAWIIEFGSWRTGFLALGLLSIISWLIVLILLDDLPEDRAAPQSLRAATGGLLTVIRQPYAPGILCLAATSYAAFLALRGLWLGPMFTERHDFSLVAAGNVVLAVSIAGMIGPFFFGRYDPGDRIRRNLIIGCSLAYVLLFAVHAIGSPANLDVALVVFNSAFAGYITLQYADLRSAYPAEMTGRALSVFTMAMFFGVAVMQWLSGIAAGLAPAFGIDPLRGALFSVSLVLGLGTFAYWLLPWPPTLKKQAQFKSIPQNAEE